MKFKIVCSFRGFVGDKAVIGQKNQARLVRYYTDIAKDLRESQGLVVSMSCRLDEDGEIWIEEMESVDFEGEDE